MNKINIYLDYNDTVDDLQDKCALYESERNRRMPSMIKGITSLASKTKSVVSISIVSSASVEGIKDGVSLLSYYFNQYCKRFAENGEPLIRYIVGNKNQEIFDLKTGETIYKTDKIGTKADGVEALLSLPSEQNANLIITGGDTKEDLEMANADTGNVPNVFVTTKENKEAINFQSETNSLIIRDEKNKSSEAIGRCLTELANNLEKYNLSDAFTYKNPSASAHSITETNSLSLAQISAETQIDIQTDAQNSYKTQTDAQNCMPTSFELQTYIQNFENIDIKTQSLAQTMDENFITMQKNENFMSIPTENSLFIHNPIDEGLSQ